MQARDTTASQSSDKMASGPALARPAILFVDDEPMILRSIRRLLDQRGDWSLLFAGSGQEALDMMAEERVDVIVSDMHMDGMNGAVLLMKVQQRYPGVVRIVLSGYTDPRLVYRAVPVAHQFLSKPFDPVLLRATLGRACTLRHLLDSPALRKVVGQKNELPSAPSAYSRLAKAMSDPDISVREVADIVQSDVAMSGRLLQLVSSAFFGLPQPVTSVRSAVAYLGIDTLKALVLSLEVFEMFEPPAGGRFSMEDFRRHSLATAELARKLIEGHQSADLAFLAGMLHDIGRLIMIARLPEALAGIAEVIESKGMSQVEAEWQVLGTSHADLGAYLLGLWGLPQPVVEAVASHHALGGLPQEDFGVLGAVQMANLLVHEARGEEPSETSERLAIELGVSDRLPRWRSICRSILGSD